MLLRKPDIGFIPTPEQAIDALLNLAQVTPTDVIYDLGSGDGRILIRAAQVYGASGVGIDIDPVRIAEARSRAKIAGVSHQVSFRPGDLFESDFRDATIVILYLLPHLNLKLRPILFNQLQPGTQILSLDFDMGDWQPQQVIRLDHLEEECTIYYWKIPKAPI